MVSHIRTAHRLWAAAVLVVATASCGDVVRTGRSPVLLVIDSLGGARGSSSTASTFAATLQSDVIVLLSSPAPCTPTARCPTVFSDTGQVLLRLVPKDSSIAPSDSNAVTISRYHISFRRADGRNTPGIDVPYGYDGAVTATVSAGESTPIVFELIRHVTKSEPPLVQLIVNPSIIYTIAEITFYGTDLVGNAISVTGHMSIDFGNFGDA
ncbi:MAG: hypothetical protein ABI868_07205 [Acidobacteriota bacterium]